MLNLPQQPEAAAGDSADPIIDDHGITHFQGEVSFHSACCPAVRSASVMLSVTPMDIQ